MFCSYNIRGVELGFDRTDATCIYGKGSVLTPSRPGLTIGESTSVCSTAIGVMAIKALLIGVLQVTYALNLYFKPKYSELLRFYRGRELA